MIFSDSHCHLYTYTLKQLEPILEQMKNKHVELVVNMGSDLDSSEQTVLFAQSNKGIPAGIGIHPWKSVILTTSIRKHLLELASSPNVVIIGEIGLDYLKTPETREIQQKLFAFQLSLAQEKHLPVNVHCREAHQDLIDILRMETGPNSKVIIHGFADNSKILDTWLNMGYYISVGFREIITNETSALVNAVREIPLNRLLVETDSIEREHLGGPADVISVIKKLAFIRNSSIEEIANATIENLKTVLNL